jgi:hypothetical protein
VAEWPFGSSYRISIIDHFSGFTIPVYIHIVNSHKRDGTVSPDRWIDRWIDHLVSSSLLFLSAASRIPLVGVSGL